MTTTRLKGALALATLAFAAQASAQVTFYEHENFQGRSFTTDRPVRDLERYGFNDRASSVVVRSERWEVCQDTRFSGRCVVLRRGDYPSLAAMGLDDRVSSVRAIDRRARVDDDRYAPAAPPDAPQVTFYEREGFRGRSYTADQSIANLERTGFNDRASSVVVVGGPWQLCDDARYGGHCVVLSPGRYPSLAAMGLNDRVSSLRGVDEARDRRESALEPGHRFERRHGERLFEVPVTSVHAVLGESGQHCWVEREQVTQGGGANVPAAIAGAVIGGILGHQVGGGTGKDLATAGGAVAGAAVGANIGRDDGQRVDQDVRHCRTVPAEARPDYWDVTYSFRGREHRVQMSAPPGPTVTVNEDGEPRG